MRAGRLRHRVTIQGPGTPSKNSHGEDTTPWVDEALVWAAVEPLTGREFFAAETTGSEVTHQVTLRYRSGITTKKRLLFGLRIFDIESVMDLTERHRELQLMCVERV